MDSVLNRNPNLTVTQRLVLEIGLYHTAVSSTFIATRFDLLPEDYVSKRLAMLGDPPPGRYYALLGVIPELFGLVFHISQLRQKAPLTPLDLSQTTQIFSRLEVLQEQLFSPGKIANAPADMIFIAQLYHLACTLLLRKVCNTSLRETEPDVQAIVEAAILILDQLTADGLESPVIPWPLIIISCGATKTSHQSRLRGPLETSWRKERLGSSLNALRLLDRAWFGFTSSATGLGLDALFCDILGTICY